MNSQECASRLRQLQSELEVLCATVQAGIEGDVFPFVSKLFSHLLRADHSIGAEELAMLAAFHRDGSSWHDEHEFARHATRASPHFLTEVPRFVQHAIRHDRVHGTHLAFAMVEIIAQMCDIMLRSDRCTAQGELQALEVLLDALHQSLENADDRAVT